MGILVLLDATVNPTDSQRIPYQSQEGWVEFVSYLLTYHVVGALLHTKKGSPEGLTGRRYLCKCTMGMNDHEKGGG